MTDETMRAFTSDLTLPPRYPKAVFFIFVNEFCERFCYYGMKSVLSLYLHFVLLYSEETSTVLYHIFSSLCYFTPLFGGILADTYLGKFKTIVALSFVYLGGNILLTLTSIDPLHIPQRIFTFLGLFLIAVGTGGIKPCVSSFGGDQFTLPDQAKQLAAFFSIFYFAINAGSLLSTFVTPIFRNDIQCFGRVSCFPLAFGVPAALIFLAIVVFLAGQRFYKKIQPSGNVFLDVCKCITHAVRRKFKVPKNERTKSHWLEYADDKYSTSVIHDIRVLLRILLLFLPVPLFWALFDQQGSRWTFQANRMDGHIAGSFTIHPDQMQLVNPLLILAFIPLFQYTVYPLMGKCGMNTPLRKITIGGLLAALSFVISALVEFDIMSKSTLSRQLSFRIYNSMDCDFDFYSSSNDKNSRTLRSMDMLAFNNIPSKGFRSFAAKFKPSASCPYVVNKTFENSIFGVEGKVSEYFLLNDTKQQAHLHRLGDYDLLNDSSARIQLLFGKELHGSNITFESDSGNVSALTLPRGSYSTEYMKNFPPGSYQVRWGNQTLARNMTVDNNGVLNLNAAARDSSARLLSVGPSGKVHMLWLLPQYIVITAAEIMFSIPGFEFAYTQAPMRMKSVVAACWLLTTAFGNLIVVFVAAVKIFDNQAYEFLLFAGLMIVDMIIFAFIAMRYKNNNPAEDIDETNPSEEKDVTINPPEVKDKNSHIEEGKNENADDNNSLEDKKESVDDNNAPVDKKDILDSVDNDTSSKYLHNVLITKWTFTYQFQDG